MLITRALPRRVGSRAARPLNRRSRTTPRRNPLTHASRDHSPQTRIPTPTIRIRQCPRANNLGPSSQARSQPQIRARMPLPMGRSPRPLRPNQDRTTRHRRPRVKRPRPRIPSARIRRRNRNPPRIRKRKSRKTQTRTSMGKPITRNPGNPISQRLGHRPSNRARHPSSSRRPVIRNGRRPIRIRNKSISLRLAECLTKNRGRVQETRNRVNKVDQRASPARTSKDRAFRNKSISLL